MNLRTLTWNPLIELKMHRFKIKEYDKGELKVLWDYPKCIHSEKCWRELGTVFRRNEKPWVALDSEDDQTIMDQIDKCPSGALSYQLKGVSKSKEALNQIHIAEDGPLLLNGDYEILHPDGLVENRTGKTALCRCGASSSKPYCDGSHAKAGFKG